MSLTFRNRKPLIALFAGASASPMLEASRPREQEVYTEYVFPVAGQGTISFTIAAEGPFRIILNDERAQAQGEHPVIVLDVGETMTCFRKRNDDAPSSIIRATINPRALLERGGSCAYWLSFDAQSRRLRLGKGEMLPQLCVFETTLPSAQTGQPDPYAYVQRLRYIGLAGKPFPVPSGHFLWPVPVTIAMPPIVVPSNALTLDDIALNRATVAANLQPAAQVLYGNVAGPGIRLNTPDFPEFTSAINYSIDTPGCWCYETLKKKEAEFGKPNPLETYLRITLGPNQGDSPGSPYVLEIWPGGHYSPIHDHGQACAVIKVLHGEIWAELYPQLSPRVLEYFAEAHFREGEVTFLSPEFYQVHKLVNKNKAGNMTATIQCYRYPATDTRHYEYFDYIGEDDTIQHFQPNSDCEYEEFKRIVKAEWEQRLTVPGVRMPTQLARG